MERASRRSPSYGDGRSGDVPAGGMPADIVRQMMGAPGALGAGMPMNTEQKKKLLWGKKAEPAVAGPAVLYGANRWDAAQFASETDKEKFEKLMGVRKVATAAPHQEDAATHAGDPFAHEMREREVFSREQQARVLGDVEAQFLAGLRRKDGRTVGLGL
ncbi:hypothetical protein WJX81_006790 [Elliptochloris bilobata]